MSAAANLARLRRFQAQLGQDDPHLAALIGKAETEASLVDDDEGAGGDDHVGQRTAADGVIELCGCVDCADDCGAYVRAHGYGWQTTVTKDGRRWRTVHGAMPGDAPGESDRWEDIGAARAVSESAPPVRQRAASPTTGKRLRLPGGWQDLARLLIDEMRTFVGERIADVERKLAAGTTNAGAGSRAELGAILERLDALEARLADGARSWAASNLADAFRGVFADNTFYSRGSIVVFGGSTWLALADCDGSERPGKSVGWRLITKRGREGREPR